MEHGAQPALIGQQVGKAIHAVIFLPDHAALSRGGFTPSRIF
jgi:hypothetical protein